MQENKQIASTSNNNQVLSYQVDLATWIKRHT